MFISVSLLINPSDMSKFLFYPRITSFSLAVGNSITSLILKIELLRIGDVVYLLDDDICLPINLRDLLLWNTILGYVNSFDKISRSFHTYIYIHTYIYWLHARLNNHYKVWSYKKRNTKRLIHTENLFRKNRQLKGVCWFQA